jgi:hypothetical protein
MNPPPIQKQETRTGQGSDNPDFRMNGKGTRREDPGGKEYDCVDY